MTVEFNVPDYSVLINKALVNTVNKAGIAVENEAKLTSPVDTGLYRNSIKYNAVKQETVANAEYSGAIEYGVKGTIRIPRPVLRNAAKKVQSKVDAIFNEELNRV